MTNKVAEAMRALGANLCDCPVCDKTFHADRYPRHWALCSDAHMSELLCSEECADKYVSLKKHASAAEAFVRWQWHYWYHYAQQSDFGD
jgi:hypothetical protein